MLERLVSLEAEAIDPEAAALRVPDATWIDDIDGDHEGLRPDILAEIKEQLRQKSKSGADLATELTDLRTRWADIRERLRASLVSPARIDEALEAAGCTTRPSQIGVEREHLERTLRVCRHIRSRYVGLDLAADLDRLDGWVPAIAAEVEGDAS